MKNVIFLTLLCCVIAHTGHSQTQPDSVLPVRGFCIGAPSPAGLNEFIKFIDQELAPRKVNTLILRVDYDYQYQSHPELSDANGLSKADIKKLVAVCKKNHIRLIPQFNLLGHQSWAGQVFALLTKYPQFDETPWVKMPEKYAWPNPDGLYCKSYCPLAPGLHKVVFEVIDELCDVFETTAFHAGMDEVFYIGEEQCPRCGGRDKAELYAGEVATLRNHLADKGRQLWIWGDRLLDGKTTGLGMWEASMNNTSRAVDLIPKDVMICDWHYDRPEKTPVYFAIKGLNVITCPWRKSEFALQQVKDMIAFRNTATPEMKERYQGMMQTVWSNAESFMDEYYGRRMPKDTIESASRCFRVMYKDIDLAIGSN